MRPGGGGAEKAGAARRNSWYGTVARGERPGRLSPRSRLISHCCSRWACGMHTQETSSKSPVGLAFILRITRDEAFGHCCYSCWLFTSLFVFSHCLCVFLSILNGLNRSKWREIASICWSEVSPNKVIKHSLASELCFNLQMQKAKCCAVAEIISNLQRCSFLPVCTAMRKYASPRAHSPPQVLPRPIVWQCVYWKFFLQFEPK